jgi:hypothetical protein
MVNIADAVGLKVNGLNYGYIAPTCALLSTKNSALLNVTKRLQH